MGGKTSAVKRNLSENSWILIILVMFLLASLPLYYFVTGILVEAANETVFEMAIHDGKALGNALEEQWNRLERTGEILKGQGAEDKHDLLRKMQLLTRTDTDGQSYLLDSEGTVYQSNGMLKPFPKLLELAKSHGDRFAIHYDNRGNPNDENRKDYLLLGRRVDIKVGGIKILYVMKRLAKDSLDKKLEIDSYGGRGLSSVIDEEGTYIIKVNRSSSLRTREKISDLIDNSRVSGFDGWPAMKEKVDAASEGMVFALQSEGTDYRLFVRKIPETEWYFVSQVPMSVFSSLSSKVILLFMALMVVIFVILGIVYFYSQRQLAKKAAMEAEHREELKAALSLAKQANRAKTVFLNNMSHDIRTPMNAIIGFTKLAAKHLENKAGVTDYLRKISEASAHLLSLINDVLDMSRIESGKVTIAPQAEDLKEMLLSLRDMVEADVRTKSLRFEVDTDGVRDKYVLCDRLRLNQILLNLLSNAIKYTLEDGAVFVSISQEPLDEENRSVYEIRVKDTGIGMSPEFARTVFEPFTREQTSTVNGIQGTGLGMAITKSLVDMMNGSIVCESEQGKGTEFIVRLPLPVLLDYEAADKAEGKTDSGIAREIFVGKRILLTEDNAFNQEIAEMILQEAGFLVETADDGQICIDMLTKEAAGYYDVILMDIQMPNLNGYEATKRIRNLPDKAKANIPIIAMTANAFEEDRQAALKAGMNGHLGKPIDVQKLLDTLADVFAG